MKHVLFIAAFTYLLCTSGGYEVYGQNLVINEFMSSNDTTLYDRDGDSPDWIELYNSGSQALNLHYYGLSDNPTQVRKWVFPDITLGPGEFLLIYASGKDRPDSSELHCNFKISSEGETLFLSNSGGALIDHVDSMSLSADQSMVRIPDGGRQWLRSSLPTPGASNEVNNQPVFSHEPGFYKAPFHLKISSLNGDTLRYTLDGSMPSDSSDFISGTLFLDYLETKANFFSEIPSSVAQEHQDYKAWESPGKPVDKLHVIRCASFKRGERSSEVYTRSYVVGEQGHSGFSMPIISIAAVGEDLFGIERGIYVPGIHLDPENPSETGNYFKRGDLWERPVHMEFFEADGRLGFAQQAGIRIHGGLTRHAAQKTVRVYARERYGKDAFDYPLLPQKSTASYKRFLLRTSMGNSDDNAIIRDVLAHELCRNLNFEIQDYQPVVVYINGEYWGIHTLRDRVDEHYLEYTSGVDSDSVDIINANPNQVVAGSNQSYKDLAGFIRSHDVSHDAHYERLKNEVDVLSLIDYVIAEMFFFNWDWPGNNQKLWRSQADGKWRWIFFDLDIAYFGQEGVFEKAIFEEGKYPWNEEPVSSFLMRNLLKNDQFKSLFLSRMAKILQEDFSSIRIYETMNKVADLYRNELPRHISRWHYPNSVDAWEDDIIHRLLTFLLNRACALVAETKHYFDMEDFGYECYSEEDTEDQLVLAPNPNNGSFYVLNNTPRGVLCSLIVIDHTGRLVHREDEVLLGGFEKKYLDLSHLVAGVYYLNYTSSNYPSYTPSVSLVKPLIIL